MDKGRGPTSHDVVAQARRLFETREVGHAGTLDPMATGVLVLLLGEACKLSAYLGGQDKSYRARVCFGTSTDTLDAEGRIQSTATLEPGWLHREQLMEALRFEHERAEQEPPALSAIHQNGERAHRLFRRGEPLELSPRKVTVRGLLLVEVAPDEIEVDLTVSSGYYVRAFARDLGARLGVPAHLGALRRTRSGPFDLAQAVPWPAPARPPLIDIGQAASRVFPIGTLSSAGTERARHGKRLGPDDFLSPPPDSGVSAWLGDDGRLLALGESETPGTHRVVRGFRY